MRSITNEFHIGPYWPQVDSVILFTSLIIDFSLVSTTRPIFFLQCNEDNLCEMTKLFPVVDKSFDSKFMTAIIV